MAVKATGGKVLPSVVAGAFKFRHDKSKFSFDAHELVAIATELVNTNPGGGTFKRVFIRSTARDELGICFEYWLGDKGSEDIEIYKDFFLRRVGAAFKGYDVGHSVTEIVLEEV